MLARDYLHRFFKGITTFDSSVSEAWQYQCSSMELLKAIRDSLTSGGPWHYVTSLVLRVGVAARLPGLAGQLMRLADGANEIYNIVSTAMMLDNLRDAVTDAFTSLNTYGIDD